MKVDRNHSKGIVFLGVITTMLSFSFLSSARAQQEEAKSDSTIELITPRVEFVSIQRNDETIVLRVTANSKVNKTFIPLYGLQFQFSNTTLKEAKVVGEAITDMDGTASITVSNKNLTLDEEGKMKFIAQFSGNKNIEATEEEVHFKKARIEIFPIKEDSVLSIQVQLADMSKVEIVPISETDIGVFVKRTFFPLKVGEGASDEEGNLTIEFPSDLPGDAVGNLIIIARVDGNEDFGNLEATVKVPWGIPVSNETPIFKGELWSHSPPLWMLLTFFILMTTVWGHYILILYKLVKLRNQ